MARLLSEYEPYRKRRLVEPFCGALAVALGVRPDQALLSDINPHLINFHRWLQRGLVIGTEMKNEPTVYYSYRDRFNDLIRSGQADSRLAAELFYYLNRTCYNGLCRFNSQGEFNVPFGRYDKINYTTDFFAYQQVVSNWEFQCTDFETLPVAAVDFIYADPPYDVEFTRYAQRAFTWDDQVRLARWLANHPGPVVASNQATERILDLYQRAGFTTVIIDAPRMISCDGNRTRAREMLACKGI